MKLHHIAYLVTNIDLYEKKLFFENKIRDKIDPIQNARLAFYSNFGSSYIELIQPTNSESFTYNLLNKNGDSYHHLCYEVETIDLMQDIVGRKKMIYIKGPLEATLLENKNVYFYFTRNKQIIEFLIDSKNA